MHVRTPLPRGYIIVFFRQARFTSAANLRVSSSTSSSLSLNVHDQRRHACFPGVLETKMRSPSCRCLDNLHYLIN